MKRDNDWELQSYEKYTLHIIWILCQSFSENIFIKLKDSFIKTSIQLLLPPVLFNFYLYETHFVPWETLLSPQASKTQLFEQNPAV